MLQDFRPVSIYNIPKTEIFKARFPVIDVHSHPYAKSQDELEQWVKTMDSVGIVKTIFKPMQPAPDLIACWRSTPDMATVLKFGAGLIIPGIGGRLEREGP